MANFLASLRSTATTLEMLQRSVTTGQNNVMNASAPGYAKQRLNLASLDFNPESGLLGGVTTNGLVSSRDRFAETAVRNQVSVLGAAEQAATQLGWVESALDLNDETGIPAAMDRLYSTFTSWSLAPSSAAEKESVYAAAQNLAGAFNRTAEALGRSAAEGSEQIDTVLTDINAIAERIRMYNDDRRRGTPADGGADARVHTDLEELSSLLNVQALWQQDGTVTVLAGGQAPLVVGQNRYSLDVTFTNMPSNPIPPAKIVDGAGNDVTSSIHSGKLGALLEFRNSTLPQYLGDGTAPGELNRLADTVSSRINQIVALGGTAPLFVTSGGAGWSAFRLEVNPAVDAADLEAADTSQTPAQVNGVAQQLAALARPTKSADMLDGLSFVGYFGKISAKAGVDSAEAKQARSSRESLVAQARNLRAETSSVSLDEEAVRLVEYQRAYQAVSRIMSTLNELTGMAVNLGRN